MDTHERPGPAPRRPSLLPAFEPFSSSPGGLPRIAKRKYDEHARDDRKYYPTPVPTSSTGMLPSSSPLRQTRPSVQRSVSALSERAPLGSVPSLDLHANGEPLLMGRSSNSSDYQISANRLISRVHVRAMYHAPRAGCPNGEVVVQCVGWNGCKIHFGGKVVDLAKDESFVSDKPGAQIMVDVQDTRIMLIWPRKDVLASTTRSPSVEQSPTKGKAPMADGIASSPPSMCPRLRSPVSPSPGNLVTSTFASTFLAGQSFDLDDDTQVQVYEDHESPGDLPSCQTPTPANQNAPGLATEPSSPAPALDLFSSQSSSLSDVEELSEHDEENDPIVHSFGPFGDNILSKFESFTSTSPNRRRKPTLKLSFPSSGCSTPKAPAARSFAESPIKNHVINQLAYSRVHSVPLSQIFSAIPADMKRAKQAAEAANSPDLSRDELKVLLDKVPCVGEISREGKDAAGKPLENEFYYMPEMDEDESRKMAVSIGKPPLRNVRKQHKQYYWKRPRH